MAEFGLPLLEWVTSAVPLLDNQVFVAVFLFAVTAGVIGLCIPGMLLPISFSAGILMDHWLAVPVVALGAVIGSHALFLAARYGMGDALEARLAGKMERFVPHVDQYGLLYVVALRVIGTPHFLVTLASAAGPINQRSFAIATLLGFLPAIALSAGAGTAF